MVIFGKFSMGRQNNYMVRFKATTDLLVSRPIQCPTHPSQYGKCTQKIFTHELRCINKTYYDLFTFQFKDWQLTSFVQSGTRTIVLHRETVSMQEINILYSTISSHWRCHVARTCRKLTLPRCDQSACVPTVMICAFEQVA